MGLLGGGHGFLGGVYEVYAGDVAEASLLHVLDDVFSYAGLVAVYGPDVLPVVLEPLDVADDGAVSRSERELAAVNQVQVSTPFIDGGHHGGVAVLPEVDADVELAPGLGCGRQVLEA